MTATITFGPPATSAGRATFTALAARETRRFVLNPVFLFAVAFIVFALWAGPDAGNTEIDTANPYPAIFLGGFGMMATYWLTRLMRASEPVVGVTPVTQPARTAALCAVALVPFACGCLALLRFVQLIPVSNPLYGPFSPSARVAVLVGQIVVPALGGPLLGVALGRWVRFPGAAFVLFLVLYGWVSLVTILSMSHQDSAPVAVLRLFAPFAFFTYTDDAGGVTAWRGSPWFFIGWQLALCAIAVLVALLRGAEGRVRTRIIRALGVAGVAALILLVLAGPRRVHPPPDRVMTGPVLRAGAWPAVAGISGVAVVVGGCGAAFPAAAPVLLPVCFALLAAAAAFTLDEPASLVVDVTPTGTGPAHRDPRRRAAGAARRRRAGAAGGGPARTGAALGGGRSRAGRQRAVRLRRGVRGPDPDRGTGRGGRYRRRAGADGTQPRAARRPLGPHVPGIRRRRPVLGHRVVDRPRRVRGGHRRLGRWPRPAPVAVQGRPSARHPAGWRR